MAEQQTPAAGEKTGEKKAPQFAMQRIYVKDISFEAPGTPHVFGNEWQPEIQVQFQSNAQRLGESLFEVTLKVSVEVANAGKNAYLVEVTQAGVFMISAPDQYLEPMLGIQCPTILFPYARETVSDLVARGTFPQLLLQPINFEVIYAESKRRQQQGAENAEAARH